MTSAPFLKWPGGKRKLAPAILAHLSPSWLTDPRSRYVEPFVGGGAVFYALRNAGFVGSVVLNDMNRRLVATYRAAQRDASILVRDYGDRLREYHARTSEDARTTLYLVWRARFNAIEATNDEVPSLMLALNATCFNGLYRENASGGFNAPHGKSGSGKPPPIDGKDAVLAAAGRALINATITEGSALDMLCALADGNGDLSGTVVYLDPPYPTEFDTYVAGGFGGAAQKDLARIALNAAHRGARVIVSNSDCASIRAIYSPADWTLHELTVTHAINRDAAGRKGKRELVIVSRGAK